MEASTAALIAHTLSRVGARAVSSRKSELSLRPPGPRFFST
jgi:hypothetical protein